MTSARHRTPVRSRARTSWRRFLTPTALAVTLTAGLVGAGVAGTAAARSDDVDLSRAGASTANSVDLGALARRGDRMNRSANRSAERTAPRVTLEPQAVRHAWSTAPLNVWTGPREQGPRTGLVDASTRLALTGQRVGHWAEVVVGKDRARWVNADYLAATKPRPETSTASSTSTSSTGPTTSGISTAPCPDGSGTEAGLVPNAVALYRAVCAAFPALTTYGGYDPHGEHADGHAIDFMISDPSLGQAVADWVRANASALHVYDVIWSQHIWTPERASEGWRYMSDRGSPTANHYDHVHVAVY